MSAAYDHYPSEQPATTPGTVTWRRDPLPVTGPYPPLFAVMGAHGFAGTTTLAQMWAPAADTGTSWPAHRATTQLVIVAARATIAGIRAAAHVLRAAERGDILTGSRCADSWSSPPDPATAPKKSPAMPAPSPSWYRTATTSTGASR
ncbi:hypothetical protein [Williamsia sp. DF01-3]|uniref:hypothetical protein n=1 Tax=Williamsia sp. DF01-3 TaxID=2934157 RepID=UPI001FF20069|nr:hypothetical protein [Williamsia sp. DF01-3]MCK0515831.1 hypothetical protein [Williamsia sp. DF01-3]